MYFGNRRNIQFSQIINFQDDSNNLNPFENQYNPYQNQFNTNPYSYPYQNPYNNSYQNNPYQNIPYLNNPYQNNPYKLNQFPNRYPSLDYPQLNKQTIEQKNKTLDLNYNNSYQNNPYQNIPYLNNPYQNNPYKLNQFPNRYPSLDYPQLNKQTIEQKNKTLDLNYNNSYQNNPYQNIPYLNNPYQNNPYKLNQFPNRYPSLDYPQLNKLTIEQKNKILDQKNKVQLNQSIVKPYNFEMNKKQEKKKKKNKIRFDQYDNQVKPFQFNKDLQYSRYKKKQRTQKEEDFNPFKQGFSIIKCKNQKIQQFDFNSWKSVFNNIKQNIFFVQNSPQQQQVNQCNKKKIIFRDKNFPANSSSIGDFHLKNTNIQWHSLFQFIPNPCIFNSIQPNDILQGTLGDCYFLAGLSALAQFPQRIKNLFLSTKINPSHSFQIKILNKGIWQCITVDEMIPCYKSKSKIKPIFSSTKSNQLWVMLLQKVWAKLYKSFENIQGGLIFQALRALTGAPVSQYQVKKTPQDQLWQKLLQGQQNNFCIVSSSNKGSNSMSDQFNITQGHAYTILGSYLLNLGKQTIPLVKLRNPWGQSESNARFNDNDPLWYKVSQSEKKRIGYVNDIYDGVFFMHFNDFKQAFHGVAIAQIRDNYSYISCKHPHPSSKNASYFRVQILNQGWYNFQLQQTLYRCYKKKEKALSNMNDLTLLIGKILNEDKIKSYPGKYQRQTIIWKSLQLQKGEYIVYAKNNNQNKQQQHIDINLSIYGQYQCHISPSDKQTNISFLPNYLIDYTFREGKATNMKNSVKLIQLVANQGFCSFLILNQGSNNCQVVLNCDPYYSHFKRQHKNLETIKLRCQKNQKSFAMARNKVSWQKGINLKYQIS